MVTNSHKPRFRIPQKTALLLFDGTDYEGAEIRVHLNVSLAYFFSALEREETEDARALLEARVANLLTLLVAWNLEDSEGQPMPITGDTVAALPQDLLLLISRAWSQAVQGGPPLPLEEPAETVSQEV